VFVKKKVSEQLGLHYYAVIRINSSLNPPPHKNPGSAHGSRFARLWPFQTAKNRTQVTTRRSRESMWALNQNRRQKSSL